MAFFYTEQNTKMNHFATRMLQVNLGIKTLQYCIQCEKRILILSFVKIRLQLVNYL